MIDFRYHLVSIVAVFLALTVGIVLGTTMLQDPLLNTLQSETADLRGQSERLRTERDEAERVGAGADAFAETLSEDVLDRRLHGLGVVLVAAPGADGDVVMALAERVEEADGSVVGRVELTSDLVDRDNETFIGELAVQVARDPERLSGTAHDRVGAELGRALADATRAGTEARAGGDEEADEAEGGGEVEAATGRTAAAVLAAFAEGGLVAVHGDPVEAADAVIVVAPAPGSESDTEASHTALMALVTALRAQVGPTVLAGDAASAAPGGLIWRVRAEERDFSTVDLAGRPMGRIITVLALAASLRGAASAYGVGEGATGFAPDPLPRPMPTEEDEVDPDVEVAEGGAGPETSRAGGEARRAVQGGE